MTIPVGWVRTLNIPLSVLAAEPTDATTYQVDTTQSGWPCGNGSEVSCPLGLTPNGSVKTGQSTPRAAGRRRHQDRLRPVPRRRAAPDDVALPAVPHAPRQPGRRSLPAARSRHDAAGPEPRAERDHRHRRPPVTLDATGSTDASSGVSARRLRVALGRRQREPDGAGGSDRAHVSRAGHVRRDRSSSATTPARPTDANDSNFAGLAFKVTIEPAAVVRARRPSRNPTAEPPPPEPGPAPPLPLPLPPPDTGPLAPRPDIPLEELPTVVRRRTGPVAAMSAARSRRAARAARHRAQPPEVGAGRAHPPQRSGQALSRKASRRRAGRVDRPHARAAEARRVHPCRRGEQQATEAADHGRERGLTACDRAAVAVVALLAMARRPRARPT